MAVVNIKLQLDADQFAAVTKDVGRDVDQFAAKVDARFESATARVTAFSFAFNNIFQIAGRLTQALAAPLERIIEVDEVAKAASETFKGKLDVAVTNMAEKLRPFVVSMFELAGAIIETDWTPFIVGVGAAGAALVAMNIGSIVSGFAALVPAIGSATTALVTFGGTASVATGGITLLVGAAAALATWLVRNQKSDVELAAARKKTAEETIAIIEAEKQRVEQSKITDGATITSTKRIRALNEELLRQQKIISDAKLIELEAQLQDAKQGYEELVAEANAVQLGVSFQNQIAGLFQAHDIKARLLKNVMVQVGGDLLNVDEQISKQLVRIGDELLLNGSNLSEERRDALTKEREGYSELAKIVGAAAQAQKSYNQELDYRKRLSEGKTGEEPAPGVVNPNLSSAVNAAAQIQAAVPAVRFDVEIARNRGALELFTKDVATVFQDADEMLALRFENNLISEEEYFDARSLLLSEFHQQQIGFFGEESRQALEVGALKTRVEEEYYAKKAQLQAQSVASFLASGTQLMASAQGVSATLFSVGKGFAYAQAIVDTYAAANKALAAYPPPFGGIAAAVAIATGLANVAKIGATNFERRAAGGFLGDESRTLLRGNLGGGEDRLIIANSGEYIVNAQATARNMELLELINAGRISSQRYQDGGFVGGSSAATAVASGSVADFSELVKAMREIKIEIHSDLDAIQFLRKNYPYYEHEEALRRVT